MISMDEMGDYYPKATPTKLELRNVLCAERNFPQQPITKALE